MLSIPETLAARMTQGEKEALRRLHFLKDGASPPDPFVLSSLIRLRLVDADGEDCKTVVTQLGRDVLWVLDRQARGSQNS